MQAKISTKSIKTLLPFFIKGFAVFMLYELLYKHWLLKHGGMDYWLVHHLANTTAHTLQLFGFKSFHSFNVVGIDGTNGVLIGPPCDGITLFTLFAGFIIAFKGPWKHKLWYIPLGIICIHILNILRIAALAIIVKYSPESLNFHHSYTFTLLVYGMTFWGWIIWVKKFALKKDETSHAKDFNTPPGKPFRTGQKDDH